VLIEENYLSSFKLSITWLACSNVLLISPSKSPAAAPKARSPDAKKPVTLVSALKAPGLKGCNAGVLAAAAIPGSSAPTAPNPPANAI